jgi:hypothetical protein
MRRAGPGRRGGGRCMTRASDQNLADSSGGRADLVAGTATT